MSEREQTPAEPGRIGRVLVERLVGERLPPFLARRVHARLQRDEAMARYYDALRRLERAAAGDPPLSDAQKRLLATLVLDGPASPVVASGTSDTAAAASAGPPSWPRALAALAGAAAAAVLFVQIEGAPNAPDGFTARGMSPSVVGVRARCLSPAGDRVLDEAEAGEGPTLAPPELACLEGGLLALSATNRGDEDLHVFVVGVAPGGETRWIVPFGRGSSARRLPRESVDVVLGDLAALSRRKHGERVVLHALFASEPFDGARVAAALDLARRQGLDVEKLPRLPLDAAAQARVDVLLGAPRGDER